MAGAVGDAGHGSYVRRPFGDATLIAFTVERRCDAYNQGPDECPLGRQHGSVLDATVLRVGGLGLCPNPVRRDPAGCLRIATEEGELTVLAVEARRIVVRTERGVSLLARTGSILRRFDVTARTAALSGKRLAVRTVDAVEVYDIASGGLLQKVPAAGGVRLEDLERDILVTASGGAVTLRRLSDGRTATIRAGQTARAQLERPGLFVAGGRRVTFTPMRDVLRRLSR